MCGRYTLKTPASEIAALFEGIYDGLVVPEFRPRYNIAPTQDAPVVRLSGGRHLEWRPLRWGLVPFWAKDTKSGARMINARSETVAEKPAFRTAFRKRRCLVPADGFFEWQKIGKKKIPYYITVNSDAPFSMAGLWERWDKEGEPIETFTILTTDANDKIRPLHDRMPVILERDDYELWLDTEFADAERLKQLMKPLPGDRIDTRRVSTWVNNPRHDDPKCIEPDRDLFD